MLLITNGTIIDPKNHFEGKEDLLIGDDGRILKRAPSGLFLQSLLLIRK